MASPERLAQLIERYRREIAGNKISLYKPYPWQLEFHEAGLKNPERMLMAANRVGKTRCAAAEVSYHMTGNYPDWWTGKKFDHPVLVWTGSPTNETSKEIVQNELLGQDLGESLGTGMIPKHLLVGKPTTRQAGVKDVADTFKVRHVSKGLSRCILKTNEQGWKKWQGTAPHVVWNDEEPDDYMIYSESQTRILTSGGIILVTFTPLLGVTELVAHFQDAPPNSGIYLKGATWDDAPHLGDDAKARLAASYRDHERDARTKGIPMMGEGAIFPLSDDKIKCDPFIIPSHFARIKGCDFGYEHHAAGAEIAWDRVNDIIYVVDCYKERKELAPFHAAWFNKSNRWIPVAWPHDGMNTEKSSGGKVKERYVELGVNMMSKSARYPRERYGEPEKGGAQPQWPVIDEIRNRMMSDKFKVFSNLPIWFDEKRSYHVKAMPNGEVKIVARRDDVLKATFYAVMMKRFGVAADALGRKTNYPQRAISSAAI